MYSASAAESPPNHASSLACAGETLARTKAEVDSITAAACRRRREPRRMDLMRRPFKCPHVSIGRPAGGPESPKWGLWGVNNPLVTPSRELITNFDRTDAQV